MSLSIVITIDTVSPVDVKDLRNTAKYLLALSGASVVQEIETPREKLEQPIPVEVNIIPPTAAAPELELDTDGKPWDYKLHSSTKAKNKDGRWKLKRNIEQNAPVEQPIAAPTPVPPPEDLLGKFMGKVTERIVSGKMTHNALSTFLRENGIPDVPSIQNFPHLLPDLIKKIEVLV